MILYLKSADNYQTSNFIDEVAIGLALAIYKNKCKFFEEELEYMFQDWEYL